MSEATIITKQLSKWYGEVRGVIGISLEIKPGIIGLVGPNGAGKTTLLNLMCGLLAPSQGSVEILGEPAFTGTHYRRFLGVVTQKEAIYPFMTVLDFITMMTRLHGFSLSESRTRAEKAIEEVLLGHKMHQKIYSLSKGMRQCLKLAQAIAHDPKILLLDELFTGCDPLVKHQLKQLLLEMANRQATILLSSHNLKEMELLTNEVVIIHCGKVAAQGKIADLQQQLKHNEHRVLIEGKELRQFAKKLFEFPDIVSLELRDEKHLTVETIDTTAFYQRLPELVVQGNFWIDRVQSLDQDLQSLFRYLVEG